MEWSDRGDRRRQETFEGAPLLGGFGLLGFLDRRGLLLDELGHMLDDILILQPVMLVAGDIDHMRVVAAAGEADIGFTRFAGTVDNAADDADRHRRGDVGDALFQRLDGLDDVEILPRTGRARDDVDAAMTQIQRLQDDVLQLHTALKSLMQPQFVYVLPAFPVVLFLVYPSLAKPVSFLQKVFLKKEVVGGPKEEVRIPLLSQNADASIQRLFSQLDLFWLKVVWLV